MDKYEDVPIREVTYVCSACGAVFDTLDEWRAHSDALWEDGEQDHGAFGYGSKIAGYEKKWVGSYQEATGTKQVLDHYECSCGATK